MNIEINLTDSNDNDITATVTGVEDIERYSKWAGAVTFATNAGSIIVSVGVPESDQATAETVGSDRGLTDAWLTDSWIAYNLMSEENHEAVLDALRDAAEAAWASA